jgi:DNA-binding NarL/FixJ family response regulator
MVSPAESASFLRVAVIDDHPVVIAGIEQLLRGSRCRVVAKATNRRDAISAIQATHPDVIVLDLRVGQDLAPDICGEFARERIDIPVLILTGHEDRLLLEACIDAGATGVLLKDISEPSVLVQALERVREGERVLDCRLEAQPMKRVKTPFLDFTAREYEMLRLLARGMTSREIAAELFLSVNTVRSYVQSLLAKLDARNRIEAVAIARENRLI